MIVASLIFLAAGQAEADAVALRFQAFMKAHPTFSVDCAISGWGGTGSGKLSVRRPIGAGVKVEWLAKFGSFDYRFTTDGSIGLEVAPSDSEYDRIPTINRPYPGGRIVTPFGFPFPLVAGNTPFLGAAKNTTLSHKGAITELKLTLHMMQGDTEVTGDFAADGRLISYDAAKGPPGRLNHEVVQFSNYRFGADATPSTFDTEPPIGLSPYAFDFPPSVLPGTAPLPNLRLTGSTTTTLVKLAQQPKILLAFVDDPMPDGLSACLERLSHATPVAVVALKGAKVNVGSLPLYYSDETGFDDAGIRATPQFYLSSGGKVVQAWSGFRAGSAVKFETDVLNYAHKL
ncbi:MAG: hypothetical protein ACYC96_09095 [Fimbriimonadaceae bacterium]